MRQTGTYALIKFYAGTTDVTVLAVNPLRILYCVKSPFAEEKEASNLSSTKEEREFELSIALVARAERVVPRMVT